MLADRLSAELRRSFLYLKQYWEQDVTQVLLCGDMPDIRSLTAPLIDRLNLEVETLDTLEGIDAATLPNGFADRASTFRLASAIAVEQPPVNLLPVEVTATRTNMLGRRIVVGGTAAAVAVGAFLYGQARATRDNADARSEMVRRELMTLQAHITPAGATVEAPSAASVAAVRTPDSQGPAMARVLESIGNAATQGVTLTALRVTAEGDDWRVEINAIGADRDRAAAHQTIDQFLRALSDAPMFAEPITSPTRRVLTAVGGVEVFAVYRVRR
jgi:hypothetical protein